MHVAYKISLFYLDFYLHVGLFTGKKFYASWVLVNIYINKFEMEVYR